MKNYNLYKSVNNKMVQCLVCQQDCKIAPGKTGTCGVRQNVNGKLQLLVFAKAAATNVDPIEKKPFYHFLPGSFAYSIGTFGCNFRCLNCQNYDISQILNHKGDVKFYSEINFGRQLSPYQAVFEAKKAGCKSIAYTYNEPAIWTEYALEIMKLAKEVGLKNIWVSNGYMTSEVFNLISPYLDAINIDIKSFDNNFYIQNCGARLEPILENCRLVKKKKIHLEITTLIIPTLSDNEKMLKQLAGFITNDLGADVPWHISAFSPEISWKLQSLPETLLSKLKKIHQVGKDTGLKYVYIGNVYEPGLDNTNCPNCGQLAIKRIGYNIDNRLKKGLCQKCQYQVLSQQQI